MKKLNSRNPQVQRKGAPSAWKAAGLRVVCNKKGEELWRGGLCSGGGVEGGGNQVWDYERLQEPS